MVTVQGVSVRPVLLMAVVVAGKEAAGVAGVDFNQRGGLRTRSGSDRAAGRWTGTPLARAAHWRWMVA